MMSKEAQKVYATFDELNSLLDRVAKLPLAELTVDEKLTLWVYLEMVRLKLEAAAYGGSLPLDRVPCRSSQGGLGFENVEPVA